MSETPDRDEAKTPEQQEEAEEDRDTGGDAEAAGTMRQREEVAGSDGGAGFPDAEE